MSSSRTIPILSALTSTDMSRFAPYMLDTLLQSEQQYFFFEPDTSGYNVAEYTADNRKVTEWFAFQLQQKFNQEKSTPPVRIELTGSRSFGASYSESDLECAVVSENFEDFLEFCRFLQAEYGDRHDFMPMKTLAGLPLLIIKSKTGFNCPKLSELYPNKTLPQIEVTFRHPSVHDIIQNAGTNFFSSLNPEQLKSYIDNKRYIALMEKHMPKDATFEPLKKTLVEFKNALSAALKCLPSGQLQNTPLFDKTVFANEIVAKVIKPQTTLINATASTMFKPITVTTDTPPRPSSPRLG